MSEFPTRLLIANRGEIALRILRTARRLGVETVAVHHAVDARMPFVTEADIAVELPAEQPIKAYLDAERIIAAAVEHGADALHPGYGLLAENAEFAAAVEAAGLRWVGPSPDAITAMGDKVAARNKVAAAGVPVSGGAGDVLASADEAAEAAARLGYPVMLKASGGGGGIGMTVLHDEESLRKAYDGTVSMAERSFGSGRVFVEKFVESARHVEVQVLGTADGTVVALGERDCSAQRRHQKIAEECPAPGLPDGVRSALRIAAVAAAEAVAYRNAGTVEFLLDTVTGDFVFLEMNTRIQVEHPVTELVYGVDLVEQQLSIAWTGNTTEGFAPAPSGHALEFRLCAEDPVRFFPSPGKIDEWSMPSGPGIRIDAGYIADSEVTQHFDPLIAKICVHADDREAALDAARDVLAGVVVGPVRTNLPFLQQLLADPEFRAGGFDTGIIARVQERNPVRRTRKKSRSA